MVPGCAPCGYFDPAQSANRWLSLTGGTGSGNRAAASADADPDHRAASPDSEHQRHARGARPQVDTTGIAVPCSGTSRAAGRQERSGQPECADDPGVHPPGNGRPVPPGFGHGDRHRLVPGPNPEPVLLPVAPPSLVNRDSRLHDIRAERDDAEYDLAARGGRLVAHWQLAPVSGGRHRRRCRRVRSGRRGAAACGARRDERCTGQRRRSAQPTAYLRRYAHFHIASRISAQS